MTFCRTTLVRDECLGVCEMSVSSRRSERRRRLVATSRSYARSSSSTRTWRVISSGSHRLVCNRLVHHYTIQLVAWRSGGVVSRMNQVTLRWVRLVLGWVTSLRAGIPPRYVTKPTRSTQPYIPPGSLKSQAMAFRHFHPCTYPFQRSDRTCYFRFVIEYRFAHNGYGALCCGAAWHRIWCAWTFCLLS